MKRLFLLFFAVLAASQSPAFGQAAVRKTVEGSMRVTGQVVIAPDGQLVSYALTRPDALPPEVRELVSRYLPAAVFEVTTASGKPETVTADMSLHVVARQSGDGGSTISIEGSQFEDPDTPDYIKSIDLSPPHYPMAAANNGYAGAVYLVLMLKPDGSVEEAHVEQVNMTVIASPPRLEAGRRMLAKAALAKARQWRFEISPTRPATDGVAAVRVPVDFILEDQPADIYGKWQVYVPGPRQRAPWDLGSGNEQALGALVSGGFYPLNSRIKLREPQSPEG